ncbi:MAG: WS/DGAT domain-containing protein [Nocardioidaceae bacterium]
MSVDQVRVPIPASDQTWLHMDRPNNLMHVHSLMWFGPEPPAWDEVLALVQRAIVDKFPVFHRVPVDDGSWFWEDDPHFDLTHHVRQTTLPAGTDVEGLRDYIGRRFSDPFEHGRPMWTMELIPDVSGLADEPRTVIFSRFHHSLADGIRLVQLLLSLCETTHAAALPPAVGRAPGGGPVAAGLDVVRRGASDAWDLARGTVAGALSLPGKVTRLGPAALEHGWDLLVHPGHLIDAVSALTSERNQSANTVAEVTRILAAGRSVRTSWSGTPGIDKQVAWVTGLELTRIRATGKKYGGTVNDILLAVISRAMTRYLQEQRAPVEEIAWLVPVSLSPFDADLPPELGNHFSLIFLPMPLGVRNPQQLVDQIRGHMTRIKESAEPVVTFGIQWVLAESPKAVAVALTNLFANKAVGVLTNVPGPRVPMTFAGAPLAGMIGWAPCSGDEPMSLSIFSYNGEVTLAVAADAALVPDPQRIADLISEEFEDFTVR